VLVDDHQVKYGSLERVIPPGQYGAGPVLLWDHGIWQPRQNIDQALRDGRLEFHFRGIKLKGAWSLIRSGVEGKDWLLIKERDEEARPISVMDIVAEMPKSVLTDRTLDEVAADPRRFASLKPNSQGGTRSKKNDPHRNQPSLPFDDPEP
jgi:bifunctional non-homologous end joining protein LigD